MTLMQWLEFSLDDRFSFVPETATGSFDFTFVYAAVGTVRHGLACDGVPKTPG